MPVRGRRPLGSPDARQAVLDAARELFSELGFERTTMRAVGARAGVDPALIYHYFDDKDGLLFAALQPPADAAAVLAGLAATAAGRTGEELVRRIIGLWEERPEIREQMAAIIRTGLSHDRAAGLLRDILSSFILAALGDVLAGDRRELRVALIGSHIGGLMLARYILQVPGAAAASPEDLVQAIGPTVQRYLTGDIGPAGGCDLTCDTLVCRLCNIRLSGPGIHAVARPGRDLPQITWWIQVMRLIRGTPVHRNNHEARINHANLRGARYVVAA